MLENDAFYATSDQMQGVSLTANLLQENTSVILANQRSNNFQSILPAISANRQLKAIPTNNALYDNYADYVDDSTRGLVNYWSMDEGEGNVIRDRIGKKNGTLKGSPKWKTINDFPGTSSKNVLEFDGVNDHIDCGKINLTSDNYTITAWIKTSSNSHGDVFSAYDSKKGHGLLIEFNQGILRYLHRQPIGKEGKTSLYTSEKYNDGKWHHIAVVKSSTKMSVYVDGSLKKHTSSPDAFTQSLDVAIGAIHRTGSGRFFKGQIADISVWNVALNAEQISDYSLPCVPLITENISKSQVSVTGVDNQPGWFTFDNGEEAFLAFPQSANGLSPIDNNLRAVATDGKITLAYNSANNTDFSDLEELKFTFKRLTTSTIRQLSQKMLIGGLDNLLTLDSQLSPELNFNRFSATDSVNSPNSRLLDFEGSLGIYFWEIFFHIPFLVANTLNSNQRFAEAQKWYHYIFNPTEPKFSYPNLVGYWSIDEGDGNVLRDRIGDNYGKVEGDTQWSIVSDFPHTSARNVLNFANEGYVKIPSGENGIGNFKGRDFSISLWFKTTDSSGTLISAGSGGDFWRIYLEDGLVKFAFSSGGGNSIDNASSNNKVNDDKWHYVTAVRDGHRSGKLYFDGVLVDDVIYVGKNTGIDAISDIFLGKNYDNTDYFQGQIAEVNICNIALSAEQVADASKNPSDRFWRFLPFRGNALEKIQDILGNDAAIATYNNNPFEPHAIAKLRIGAYEKAIVMKYIDNLLDWGDQLFAQDNRESINEATLLYFLAYDLLGEEPENLGKRRSLSPKTFQEIAAQYRSEQVAIPQFLIELENRVNNNNPSNLTSSPFNDLNAYFCAPENEQFIAYWQRVEDRLYKIRHSLSIEGIRRQLALFQPAIDPDQLVRAVAGGVTPLSVVSQLAPAVPNYRFDYMLERAKNTTSTLIQLGASLLSALEKKDAEELALLRSSHEQSILKLITLTKEKQLDEANETLASLEESKKNAEKRFKYYAELEEAGLFQSERNAQNLMKSALAFQTSAIPIQGTTIAAYLAPNTFGLANGGMRFGDAVNAGAAIAHSLAGTQSTGSGLADKNSMYDRRAQEWDFQKSLAEIDQKQIEKQIAAQKIRVQIAEQELKVHKKSIEQAKEIEDFLKDKFTNQELYQWMVSRLSILYFQTYKIALDMAMATQSAYQYELNKNDTFINFNYWDSLKKGLLSGESLMLGLNQLEKAYIEGNVRRLEIEKTISLLQLNPQAFQQLKETGKCELELSEKLFDFDFPGHYARQIKTLAVSIPAVVGPYQNISATLTQTSNKTLLEPDVNAVEYLLTREGEQPDNSILRSNWRHNQKIALSRAAMDNGLFELNFFWDMRYLPFEATGAVSTWELSLPKQTNRIDFDTISDVIITLSYTALDGGDVFREKVTELSALKSQEGTYYLSLNQEFSGAWHEFTNSKPLAFSISENIIPPHLKDTKLTKVLFKLDLPEETTIPEGVIKSWTINGSNQEIKQPSTLDNYFESENLDLNFAGDWVIDIDSTELPDLKNIELILMYTGEIDWKA